MGFFRFAVPLALAAAAFALPAAHAETAQDGRFIRLSFSDGRPDAVGLEAVDEQLGKVGVRVSEVPIPEASRSLIETSKTRALDGKEQSRLLSIFSLDRDGLLDQIAKAGRKPAVEGGGALSISEKDVPPYPKVYDMKALDAETVAFLMRKFGRLHVNSADDGHGIDEVMTIVSGGPYTWFFALEDETVAKVRFSEVKDGEKGWRISYPGLGPHGGYFDAPHGLVVALAHGPERFVMRYEAPNVKSSRRLNDNPWIDFTANPPLLLDRSRDAGR
ncbi:MULTISPECIES: hypothetical protein [unclassified Aureimonas]|uniref:hypothetical protein n=1 Tax=unclassified Aureimonas TaxID=2615206 RepID=UPI0006F3BC13|nr:MULTISPECIES: hypothetical protein [unclassified Aureimonas]KQT52489.1 hypothetical protein ASG62_14820 [Aureimonas sp. Leaf427]KQT77610.1 hypothetical protein ASG54_11590 [Aureimonas sp. Leaf460]